MRTNQASVPDLRYVSAFAALYELGSVHAAAAALHRSQPAITYQIQSFEREMGTQLFDRVGRRLVANAAAQRVYGRVRTLIDDFTVLRAELSGVGDDVRTGQLSIASVSGFGRYVLCPTLCRREFAQTHLGLSFATATDVMDRVESGAADLGFVYRRGFSTRLEFTPCFDEELVLIGARTTQTPGSLGAMSRMAFVTYVESDYVFAHWFETVFARQPDTLTSVHHVDELEETMSFVAAGRGLSIVPLDAVLKGPFRNRLRVHRPLRRKCVNQVYSLMRATGLVTHEVRLLLANLGK